MKRQTSKKQQKPKKSKKTPFDLIERRLAGRKVIQFPMLEGRTVERVRLFSSKDDHCISINFQDKTLLSFHFDLGFALHSSLSDIKDRQCTHHQGMVIDSELTLI